MSFSRIGIIVVLAAIAVYFGLTLLFPHQKDTAAVAGGPSADQVFASNTSATPTSAPDTAAAQAAKDTPAAAATDSSTPAPAASTPPPAASSATVSEDDAKKIESQVSSGGEEPIKVSPAGSVSSPTAQASTPESSTSPSSGASEAAPSSEPASTSSESASASSPSNASGESASSSGSTESTASSGSTESASSSSGSSSESSGGSSSSSSSSGSNLSESEVRRIAHDEAERVIAERMGGGGGKRHHHAASSDAATASASGGGDTLTASPPRHHGHKHAASSGASTASSDGKPAKGGKHREAATDALGSWWTPASQQSADHLNLVYAGEAAFARALVLLFSSDLSDAAAAGSHVQVLDRSGKTVSGNWSLGKNPRMLVLQGIPAGRYTVIVGPEVADATGKTLGTKLVGPVFVH